VHGNAVPPFNEHFRIRENSVVDSKIHHTIKEEVELITNQKVADHRDDQKISGGLDLNIPHTLLLRQVVHLENRTAKATRVPQSRSERSDEIGRPYFV